MRCLDKNRRTVHRCSRIGVGGVETFGVPRAIRLNFRNSKQIASMESMGESNAGTIVATTDARTAALFCEFDKVYVFTTPPMTHDLNASGADYVVDGIMPGLDSVELRMKRVNR